MPHYILLCLTNEPLIRYEVLIPIANQFVFVFVFVFVLAHEQANTLAVAVALSSTTTAAMDATLGVTAPDIFILNHFCRLILNLQSSLNVRSLSMLLKPPKE